MDEEGNLGSKTIEVTCIDKTSSKAVITYSITFRTTEKVIATISSDEEIIILNNEGQSSYTFAENGHFTFVYQDLGGNKATLEARVNWITKYTPPGVDDLPTTPDDESKDDEVTYIPIQNSPENKLSKGDTQISKPTKPYIKDDNPVDDQKDNNEEDKSNISHNDNHQDNGNKQDDSKKESKSNEKVSHNCFLLIPVFFFGLSLIYLGFKGRKKE